MSAPRLLVIEGNTAEGRAQQMAAGGGIASEGYAKLLRGLLPGSKFGSGSGPGGLAPGFETAAADPVDGPKPSPRIARTRFKSQPT